MASKEYNRQYYLKHKEKIKAQTQVYREANKEHLAEKAKEYYLDNIDDIKAYQLVHREDNRDKAAKNTREWYYNNKERASQSQKEYRKKNSDKVRAYDKERSKAPHRIAAKKEWRENNKDLINAKNSRDRAAKLQRTVAWADNEAIKDVYRDCEEINLAARTAGSTERYVVDHEIPLQGELVSGLHVHTNLQIILESHNCSKNNSFTPGPHL